MTGDLDKIILFYCFPDEILSIDLTEHNTNNLFSVAPELFVEVANKSITLSLGQSSKTATNI